KSIILLTNKRSHLCNPRNITTYKYEKIVNIDIFKKTFYRLTLTLQYNRNNIQFTNIHTDEKNITDLFSFLSNLEYDKKINFSEILKTTEIPIYNNMKIAQQTKHIIEEKLK